MAGEGSAAKLCRAGFASIEEIADAPVEEPASQVEDIGPKVAASACARSSTAPERAPRSSGCASAASNLDVLDEDRPPEVAADAPLAGKTVVVTGSMADPRSGEKIPRPAFSRLCERAGATVASSVSAGTDMLIYRRGRRREQDGQGREARGRGRRPGRDLEAADRGRDRVALSGRAGGARRRGRAPTAPWRSRGTCASGRPRLTSSAVNRRGPGPPTTREYAADRGVALGAVEPLATARGTARRAARGHGGVEDDDRDLRARRDVLRVPRPRLRDPVERQAVLAREPDGGDPWPAVRVGGRRGPCSGSRRGSRGPGRRGPVGSVVGLRLLGSGPAGQRSPIGGPTTWSPG